MPNSEVPRVELNQDGTISLEVNVDGFDAGTPVEISGQATQANGAIATFYERPDNARADGGHGVILVIHSVPVVGTKKFEAGFPITVVVRATEAWITTLEPRTRV